MKPSDLQFSESYANKTDPGEDLLSLGFNRILYLKKKKINKETQKKNVEETREKQ